MDNELKLILFLHVLAAALMAGGILAFALLVGRARGTGSAAEQSATLSNAHLLQRSLIQPAAGLTGIIGLLLALRYDAKGLFQFSAQGWIHISILLWFVLMGITGYQAAALRRSLSGGSTGEVTAALSSGRFTALLWGSVLLTVVVIFLMVFQPGR